MTTMYYELHLILNFAKDGVSQQLTSYKYCCYLTIKVIYFFILQFSRTMTTKYDQLCLIVDYLEKGEGAPFII